MCKKEYGISILGPPCIFFDVAYTGHMYTHPLSSQLVQMLMSLVPLTYRRRLCWLTSRRRSISVLEVLRDDEFGSRRLTRPGSVYPSVPTRRCSCSFPASRRRISVRRTGAWNPERSMQSAGYSFVTPIHSSRPLPPFSMRKAAFP